MDWNDPLLQTFSAAELEALPRDLQLACGEDTGRAYEAASSRKIDLNQDGLPDWIFRTGCPYPELSVMLSLDTTGQRYQVFQTRIPGTLHRIYREGDQTIVRIRSEACCCHYDNYFLEWRIGKGEWAIRDYEYLIWTEATAFPEVLPKEDLGSSEIRQGVVLRSGPKIKDNPINDPCQGGQFRGNQLGRIKMGTGFRILARQQDAEGREWEFVELTNTNRYEHFEDSQQGYRADHTLVMGWISR